MFLRRLVGLVLALSFGMFSAEALIADVCDGDAPATEIARIAADAGAHAAYGSAESQSATRATAVAPAPDANRGDGSGPALPDGPTHSGHVCHCGHAHVSMTALSEAPQRGSTARTSIEVAQYHRPPSVARTSALRPPIA
ncbi:MAG: hypothetical protein ABI664_00775 [bacterium]